MKRILAIALIFVLAICPVSAGKAQAAESMVASRELGSKMVSYTAYGLTGTMRYDLAFSAFNYINNERARSGLSYLTMDSDLVTAAMQRAAEIVIYFEHSRPNGSFFNTVSTKANYENIAYGYNSAELAVTAWLASSSHRMNALAADATVTGVGCFQFNGNYYWVQLFGRNGNTTNMTAPLNSQTTITMEVDSAFLLSKGIDSKKIPKVQVRYIDDEGATFPSGTTFRLLNPNSGEHFFTTSLEGRNSLFKDGWLYEGVAWSTAVNTGSPVYKLYNPNTGDHMYTVRMDGRDALVKIGWGYEGIAFYSYGDVPVYRLYNPKQKTGNHHFTTSYREYLDYTRNGWKDEGIGWYVVSAGPQYPAKDGSTGTATPGIGSIITMPNPNNDGLVLVPVEGAKYVMDTYYKTIHKRAEEANCYLRDQIHTNNKTGFNGTVGQAEHVGYYRCSICLPN